MELRHLRYFAAVVKAKGYRNASRHLHIAQPALSQTVADLEDEMGLKLFIRKGSGVHLTAAGEVFHKECRQILEQVEFAVAATKRADKGKTELLRIGFIPSTTQHFLPELIREYGAEVDQPAMLVDGAEQVLPLATNCHIRFIHPPGTRAVALIPADMNYSFA